jgi:hypothetical protein
MLRLSNSFAFHASDESSIRGVFVSAAFFADDVSMMLVVVNSHYLFPPTINNRQAG